MLEDSELLLAHRRYSNAYYLAGYAVEVGLKACIAARIVAETIPDKDILRKFLIHEFEPLVGLAGLTSELKHQKGMDVDFAANWAVVTEWKPDARYDSNDPTSALTLITAIAKPNSGVLSWIKAHW